MSNSLVILGLGSNINALQNFRKAILFIRQLKNVSILKLSRIYESKALTKNNEIHDDYLNSCLLLEVQNFQPDFFLLQIQEIEKKMGRKSTSQWQPREIDLDILYVEVNSHQFVYSSKNLNIPHSEFYKRPFAFYPALELFPHLKNINEILFTDCIISDRYDWPEFSGIINITPDSFSDGGLFYNEENIFNQAQKLFLDGADYIDLGAESTRPGAEVLTTEEELRRLKMALNLLQNFKKIKISIDSRNYETLKFCLENYDIDMINDVSGFKDERIIELIKSTQVKAVCMHSLTVPADKNIIIQEDPLSFLSQWWIEKIKFLDKKNINLDQTYFDPGVGFGKSSQQSLKILENLIYFKDINQKIYLGYSRKSFLNEDPHLKILDKDLKTAKVTTRINLAYAQVIRVHNIQIQKQALRNTL